MVPQSPALARMNLDLRQLTRGDLPLMHGLLDLFGHAFDDTESYCSRRPSPEYLQRLLGSDSFIALVALVDGVVVAGLAAYELHKFEQERSEIYIYDLAVAAAHRRRGLATALIEKLKAVARERGAYVLFVQADTDPDDEPAIALYSKLGSREEVLHFDFAVELPEAER